MKLLVIGVGYVGLVTGTCFAEMGHQVVCLDTDEEKIALLKKRELPFFEPGLKELLERNQTERRLHFTTDYAKGIKEGEVCIIAVGTPPLPDGSTNLSYLKQVVEQIGEEMEGYKMIITKSTVPVGTAKLIKKILKTSLESRGENIPFDVVSNPEFLKEGSAVEDCMKPDRIIIGSDSPRAISLMKKLYSSFNLNRDRILVMDSLSAELTKYASNAMLALRVSFMNELSGLCEKFGANINSVRMGMSGDQRIGSQFLYAGVGYGGSCFSKDLSSLEAAAKNFAYETPILSAIEQVNERQKYFFCQKILDYFTDKGGIGGKKIALWGLSFKPNTDDMRKAPSLTLITTLHEKGALLRLYDPIAMRLAKRILLNKKGVTFCKSEYEAGEGADAIVLVTEWKQFRFVNLNQLLSTMRGRAFFDGRNQYNPDEMRAKGFHYFGVGIPSGPSSLLEELKKQEFVINYDET